MVLDLREFAQWACSRAAHPARLKTTGLGIRNASTWERCLLGCPWAGIQFLWWQSRNILLRPRYYWSSVSSMLCVLLGRCAGLFPKSHSTHTQNFSGVECLLVWSLSRMCQVQSTVPNILPDEETLEGSVASSPVSVFVEGIIFYWTQDPFQPLLLLLLFVFMELDWNYNELILDYFLVINTFVMCCEQTGKGISFPDTVSAVSLFATNYVF